MNSDLTEIVWKKSAINFTKLMCYQSQKKKKLVQIFIYYGVKMILFFYEKNGVHCDSLFGRKHKSTLVKEC